MGSEMCIRDRDDSDLSKLISDECINRDCTVKQVESGYSIVSVN